MILCRIPSRCDNEFLRGHCVSKGLRYYQLLTLIGYCRKLCQREDSLGYIIFKLSHWPRHILLIVGTQCGLYDSRGVFVTQHVPEAVRCQYQKIFISQRIQRPDVKNAHLKQETVRIEEEFQSKTKNPLMPQMFPNPVLVLNVGTHSVRLEILNLNMWAIPEFLGPCSDFPN